MREFSLARTVRFFGIGGLSTAIYWIVLLALTSLLHLNPTAASVAAYGVGFVAAYLGHRKITYRSDAFVGHELTRFLIIQMLCFIIGNLAFWAAVAKFGLPVIMGGALLTLVNVGLSYLAYEIWVFRPGSRG